MASFSKLTSSSSAATTDGWESAAAPAGSFPFSSTASTASGPRLPYSRRHPPLLPMSRASSSSSTTSTAASAVVSRPSPVVVAPFPGEGGFTSYPANAWRSFRSSSSSTTLSAARDYSSAAAFAGSSSGSSTTGTSASSAFVLSSTTASESSAFVRSSTTASASSAFVRSSTTASASSVFVLSSTTRASASSEGPALAPSSSSVSASTELAPSSTVSATASTAHAQTCSRLGFSSSPEANNGWESAPAPEGCLPFSSTASTPPRRHHPLRTSFVDSSASTVVFPSSPIVVAPVAPEGGLASCHGKMWRSFRPSSTSTPLSAAHAPSTTLSAPSASVFAPSSSSASPLGSGHGVGPSTWCNNQGDMLQEGDAEEVADMEQYEIVKSVAEFVLKDP